MKLLICFECDTRTGKRATGHTFATVDALTEPTLKAIGREIADVCNAAGSSIVFRSVVELREPAGNPRWQLIRDDPARYHR